LSGLTDTTSYAYYTTSSAGNYNVNDLHTITDALGHVTTVTQYSASGLPTSVTDMNSVVTTFTYDARERLTSRVVDAGGSDAMKNATTSYTYCPLPAIPACPYGLLHTVDLPTTASGHYMTYAYDRAHRLTSVVNNVNETKTFTYTYGISTSTVPGVSSQNYDIEEQRFANSGGTAVYDQHITRDDQNSTVIDTDGMGDQTVSQLDPNGNVVIVTDPLGHTTTESYDALNRVNATQGAISSVPPTLYFLDALDHPTKITSPKGADTLYVYDAFGELLQQNSPDSGLTTYNYNNWLTHAQIASTDAKGQTQTYTYDAVGRLLLQHNGLRDINYTYDDPSLSYSVGRLTKVTDISESTTYAYDSHGNVAKKWISPSVGSYGYISYYTRDLADNLTQIQYPSHNGTVIYQRDAVERISEVQTTYDGGPTFNIVSGIAYMPFGPLKGLNYKNGLTETRVIDKAYRLDNITTSPSIQNLTYAYNRDDTVQGITDGLNSANNQTFTYDAMQRLLTANGPYGAMGANETISIGSDPLHFPGFSYDGDGNRTQMTINGTTTIYGYNAGTEQLANAVTGTSTTSYGYDANGSMLTDGTYNYSYDILGRNTKVTLASGGSTVYTAGYNFLGERVLKTVGSTTTFFAYDEQGHLIAEIDSVNGIQKQHIWLGDREVAYFPENINGAPASDIRYIHVDRTDTPVAMTESNQAITWQWKHDPWGNGGGSTSYYLRFPGQYKDPETGRYQNWMRDYDPQTGRYLQSDPIGLNAGINTYTYVDNNPVDEIDPQGTDGLVIDPELPILIVTPPSPGSSNWAAQGASSIQNGWDYLMASFDNMDSELVDSICPMAGHSKNKRPSTADKHQKGDKRRNTDYGGEKGDQNGSRRPPRNPPPNWQGGWPPKPPQG
jgi:RHS repeat-associated protein